MRIDSVAPFPSPANAQPSAPERDAAFAARPRLRFLHRALVAEVQRLERRARRGVPRLFFFDPARQAELEAARVAVAKPEPHPVEILIEETLPELYASVEVRRAARAVAGLKETADRLSSTFSVAKELADVLAVPDDEAVLVLEPARRAGYRLLIRGVADVAQFQNLLAEAIGGEPRRWQFFRPGAVLNDGTLPGSFRGCRHWLWGTESLATVPRVDGERVVLLGPATIKSVGEVEARFPGMAAEVRLLEILNPFIVAERLGRLAGQHVPVRTADVRPLAADAKAA